MRHLQLHIHPAARLARAPWETLLAGMPVLAKLLRRGHARPSDLALSQACCTALGIARQQDWPLAPHSAKAAGLDAGQGYWLRLDPVFLDVGMQGLFLRGGLSLREEEIRALAPVIESAFCGPGQTVFPGPDGIFHLRLDSVPRLTTTPLDQVDGRQPTRMLPQGADAPGWTRQMHDIQMALHEHPVNQQRLDRGDPPVNSFWAWGGGQYVQPRTPPGQICTAQPLALAMATSAHIPVLDPRLGPASLLDSRAERAWILLDDGVFDGTVDLQELDARWLAPLFDLLRTGRLAELEIRLIGPEGQSARLTPLDAWCVWR